MLILVISLFFSEECPICLDALIRPRRLKCRHTFCTDCLQRALDTSNKCPVCQEPQGVLQGNQPPGHMGHRVDPYCSVPGYEGKTVWFSLSYQYKNIRNVSALKEKEIDKTKLKPQRNLPTLWGILHKDILKEIYLSKIFWDIVCLRETSSHFFLSSVQVKGSFWRNMVTNWLHQ